MIIKWLELETDVTPKMLRSLADKLDREMKETDLGSELPAIKLTCPKTHTRIVLRADQEAWHNKDKGAWS